MQKEKFQEMLSLVNEYLECYTNLEEQEIRKRINDAFTDDEISGTEYDCLIALLEG